MMWHNMAWHNMMWHNMMWHNMAWHSLAWPGLAQPAILCGAICLAHHSMLGGAICLAIQGGLQPPVPFAAATPHVATRVSQSCQAGATSFVPPQNSMLWYALSPAMAHDAMSVPPLAGLGTGPCALGLGIDGHALAE